MSLFVSRSTTLCGVLLLTVALLSISVQCAVWPIVEIEAEKSVPVPLSWKQKVKRFFKDPYNIGALTAEEKEHALIYETKSMYALTEAKEIEDERERLVIGLIAAGATCGVTFLLCLGAVVYWGVMVSKQRRVRYVEELEMVRS